MEDARDKSVFTIDAGNDIALRGDRELSDGMLAFTTENELGTLAADWPSSRLLDIWNRVPGCAPVKKFTDRKTAIRRIWKAVQTLATPSAAGRPARQSKLGKAKSKPLVVPQAGTTKSQTVVALLRQPGGATLKALMAATGWQAHSVRGFISGQLTKKMRLKIRSFKREGERVYSLRS